MNRLFLIAVSALILCSCQHSFRQDFTRANVRLSSGKCRLVNMATTRRLVQGDVVFLSTDTLKKGSFTGYDYPQGHYVDNGTLFSYVWVFTRRGKAWFGTIVLLIIGASYGLVRVAKRDIVRSY